MNELQPFSIAFMLAQATNDALDAATKSDNMDAITRNLTNIVTLMSCLEDKDRYLHYLSLSYSKRLLDNDMDVVSRMDGEKQLNHIIKSKLGSEFSKNLEAMVSDVENCYEKKQAIAEYFEKHAPKSLIREFHVNVLSNCEWLLPTTIEMSPPANILMIQKMYEEFYQSDPANASKRLEWNYNLGTLEFRYNWQGKDFIIVGKPYHYFVLQLLERSDRDTVSLLEISQALNVQVPSSLAPIIDSLLAAPKILIKTAGPEGSISAGDRFALNPDFKSKTKKVVLRDARFEDKFKGKSIVDDERVLAIQGCIVRVMKSNKIMEYSEVVRAVEKLMLKFSPTSKVSLE